MSFTDQLRSGLNHRGEVITERTSIIRNDSSASLIQAFALDRFFIVARDAHSPSLLEIICIDLPVLGENLAQCLDHHVIVETSCRLLLCKLQQLLEAILCARQCGLERADPLKQ